jgi:hypothetical protein
VKRPCLIGKLFLFLAIKYTYILAGFYSKKFWSVFLAWRYLNGSMMNRAAKFNFGIASGRLPIFLSFTSIFTSMAKSYLRRIFVIEIVTFLFF